MLYGIGCDLCSLSHLEKAFPLPTQQPLCAGCTARLSRRRWGFWKALLRR